MCTVEPLDKDTPENQDTSFMGPITTTVGSGKLNATWPLVIGMLIGVVAQIWCLVNRHVRTIEVGAKLGGVHRTTSRAAPS